MRNVRKEEAQLILRMHELRKVLVTLSSTMQLILGHIQLCTRNVEIQTMNVIGAQQDIPLFVFQTKAVAIFATHVTTFGFAGLRDV